MDITRLEPLNILILPTSDTNDVVSEQEFPSPRKEEKDLIILGTSHLNILDCFHSLSMDTIGSYFSESTVTSVKRVLSMLLTVSKGH